MTALAELRPVVLMTAVPSRRERLEGELGPRRYEATLRELALLVRRSLRGTDAVALHGDELLILLDAPLAIAAAVATRVLTAVRAHSFTGGASDSPARLTLAAGLAAAPEHGHDFDALIAAARAARSAAGEDHSALAFSPQTAGLDLERFVGRAAPLDQLTEYLDDMVRGAGRVVAVIGESGVGSSALLRMLCPEVRLRGGSLVSAACHRQRLPEPYALWSEVLRAVRRLPVKSTRQWRELPLLDASLERAPEEQGRGGSTIRLLEELGDFLRLAAQQRPLFLMLDDMQWADEASWDALEYLIPQLESERVVLGLTIRVDEQSNDALERWSRLGARPRHAEVRMTRLTRDDVKRWVEGAMAQGDAGRDLLAYLYRSTEGNPLHLAHLLRDLEESGHLARADDGWRWSALRDLPPVSAFGDVMARRLERLPPDCLEMLELAAVFGREFDGALLERAGGWSPEHTRALLRCAIDARLLVPTYERGRPSYLFAHDDVARLTRERTTEAPRAALHARIAAALVGTDLASAAELASHFEAAGERTATHEYATRAADASLAVYDASSAATLLHVAARHAPHDAALARVRVRLATLADAAGRYDEAEGLTDLALAWYESQGDRLQTIELKRMKALLRMQRGQTARETLDSLLPLVAEAEAAGADAERAAILLVISQMLARLGEIRESQRVAEECVAIAERCEDPVLLSDSYNRRAIGLLLTDPSRARELFVAAIELVVPLNESFRQARLLNNLGSLELHQSRWPEARERLTVAAEFARAAGLTEHWARAALNLGVVGMRTGDFAHAKESLGEALRLSAEVQHSELQLIATYNLANLARDVGDYLRGGEIFELAAELAERIGQSDIQVGALAGLGLCRLAQGDAEHALRVDSLLASRLAGQTDWFQGRELVESLGIRLAMQRERGEAAQRFVSALAVADTGDVYGAAFLTAELGAELLPVAPDAVEAAVRRYAEHPEVVGNPRIREKFAVLILDSAKSC